MLSFTPAVTYPIPIGPQDVAAGDFNGDGHHDLATANLAAGVGVLLNKGDGTFHGNVSYSLDNHYAWNVVTGDLDADGNLDLTVTTTSTQIVGYYNGYYGGSYPIYRTEGHVKVLLGSGDGSFTPGATVDLGEVSPTSCAQGDLDGDGDLDVAVALSANNAVKILLGNGDGTFAAPTTVTVGASVDMDIADLNADGNADLVVSGNVLLGNGDGTFQNAVAVANDYRRGQAVGDINGDGKLDLVVGTSVAYYGYYYSEFHGYAKVLLGNGDGTFAAGTAYPMNGALSGPVALELADTGGDGKLDIAVIDGFEGAVDVFRNKGDGTFEFPARYSTGVPYGAIEIVVADLNGDPGLEIVTANYANASVSVLLNTNGVEPPPPPPSMSIDDVTIAEGNTGTRSAIFTVTLSSAAAGPVTVAYATANGSATANGDYQSASGSLSFAPGDTSKTITVLVKGDRAAESDETFVVSLSGASGATIGDGQGVGTIVDDEPRISISDVTKKEGNSGTTRFVFTVSLSSAAESRVTVDYATANGTARKNDDDYVAKSGKLTFAPGETSKAVTILVKGDTKNEVDESFVVNLSNAKGALIEDDQGEGTILNDDRVRRNWSWLAFDWDGLDDAIDDFLSSGRRRRGR